MSESTAAQRIQDNDDARIAIIGGGKMGEAMLAGWLSAQSGPAGTWSSKNFTVVDPGRERRDQLTNTYGVTCVADSSELGGCDLIVFSVKPQVFFDVTPLVASLSFASSALYISVAAGIPTIKIEAALPAGAHVVRVMPNTPLLVGAGTSAVCKGASADDADVELVRDLFACIGDAYIVDESQIDTVCAISGSGPAYVAALIEQLAEAGAHAGLDRDLAEKLALGTVGGTARLMVEREQSARKTRIDVSSPGGTTLAALEAMEATGFHSGIHAGVRAAIQRSKELGA